MTTIIYKNGIMASDTRTTARTSVHSKVHCLHCGEKECGYDTTVKIVAPFGDEEKAKFRGEPIYAMAFSGTVSWGDSMIEMLSQGEDVEAFNNRAAKALGTSPSQTGSVMIATTTSVYIYCPYRQHRDEKVRQYPLDTPKVLTLGSGGRYAYAAATAGKLSAVEAVGAAGQCDKSTSLVVKWVDCKDHSKKEIQTTDFTGQVPLDYFPE